MFILINMKIATLNNGQLGWGKFTKILKRKILISISRHLSYLKLITFTMSSNKYIYFWNFSYSLVPNKTWEHYYSNMASSYSHLRRKDALAKKSWLEAKLGFLINYLTITGILKKSSINMSTPFTLTNRLIQEPNLPTL